MNRQDSTFTTAEDRDINVKCPKEALRKWQFIMHLVFDAGKADKSHGWCDLVCKGTGTQIKKEEKAL